MNETLRIGFDIGGVLSKYPEEFTVLLSVLKNANCEIELFVITDIPKEKAIALLEKNGFLDFFYRDNVYSADWAKHGDRCKEIIMKDLKIDIMFDDRMDYIMSGCQIGCLIMPRTDKGYYHETWQGNLDSEMLKINDRLFLGSYNDAIDAIQIKKNNINSIVSVGKEKHTPENLYSFPIYRFNIINELPEEQETNDDWEIIYAVEKICELYREGKTVLVHCISCKNRSPIIMSAVLVRLGFNKTIEEGLEEIGKQKELKSMPKLLERVKRIYNSTDF